MCGIASASRTISTGPESPSRWIVPLICGSERRAWRYAPAATAATMTTRMQAAISSLLLKTSLDRLYADFNYPDSATDPIHIVRRFERADDREIVGFCAAALAFGRVASVLQSIERLLQVVGPYPAAYVRSFDARQAVDFSGLGHRWIRSVDLVALVGILRGMLDRSGSVERFFAEGHEAGAADVGAALDSFSRRALSLAPPQRR